MKCATRCAKSKDDSLPQCPQQDQLDKEVVQPRAVMMNVFKRERGTTKLAAVIGAEAFVSVQARMQELRADPLLL